MYTCAGTNVIRKNHDNKRRNRLKKYAKKNLNIKLHNGRTSNLITSNDKAITSFLQEKKKVHKKHTRLD